ncbi:MAG: hypothetical protein HY226_04455, partial [Candidatus Vogelbacteria bacterium]|nr:hypothetical protein [Candidatus Vogelbacteria bacterium]
MSTHKNQNLVGRLSLASKKGGYFLHEGSVKREDEIFIESNDLATALNGDKVEVNGKKIVRILERAKKQFTGTVKSDHNCLWLKPYDTKVFSDILIEDTPNLKVADGDRVIVEITNWKDLAGKVVQNIGRAGDNNTEMHTIMFEHKI